jgi:hypothetical protein
MPGFGKGDDTQSLLLRDFHGLIGKERLLCKPPNVFVHLLRISSVGIPREVRDGNYAEFADFLQCVHLGFAEEIGAIADVVGARRITAWVAGVMLLARLGAIATADIL